MSISSTGYRLCLLVAGRLNAPELATKLSVHVERAVEGDLHAFLLADTHFFSAPIGYCAANWHDDSTTQRYQELWGEALAVARQIKDLPNSSKIFNRVHSLLLTSATTAHAEISEKVKLPLSQEDFDWRSHGSDKLEIIRDVIRELSIMLPNADDRYGA